MGRPIVILGWGSLIWNPQTLQLASDWQQAGPDLPIEFSRVSRDGRLTAVIDPVNGKNVKVLYAFSKKTMIEAAIEDLSTREGTIRTHIGFVDAKCGQLSSETHSCHERIKAWGKTAGIDIVIWTALASNFMETVGVPFSTEAAIEYLGRLSEHKRMNAIQYISNAPEQISTPLRQELTNHAKARI